MLKDHEASAVLTMSGEGLGCFTTLARAVPER
jgi:hypothetical protein